jgi:tetratricopeptide (TPR) repeat protein
VYVLCALALVVTVVAEIVNFRRRDDESVENPTFAGETRIVSDTAESRVARTASPAINSANALHQLRAPVGDFVGRSKEIETLVNALRNGSHVGINGMGGIGKTELALVIAARVADNYPDAQFFINLQGSEANPRSPDEVLAICIRAFLGPETKLPEDLDQLLQLYRGHLTRKRALLLFDNAADSGQIQRLLPPPGSVVMVTSRQAVTLPGITRFKLNPLTDDEAQKLLLKIARHAKPAAGQICELCGYLPLAIRAAGSLLAVTDDLDPVAYTTQLKDERKRFEHIGKEGVEIDVAASFNLSYERLSPPAALVFRLLSVFAGTFDATGEETVCDDKEHVQLTELVRRSLVLFDSSTKRYRLHDLARLFANSKLSDEERAIGQKRHAIHYNAVLVAADRFYLQGGQDLARGLGLFDLEWANIQAGQAWVAAQDFETDQELARLSLTYGWAGAFILDLRQHPRERIRWLERALTVAQGLKDRDNEGVTVGNLGSCYLKLGDVRKAIELYEKRLVIAREIGDHQGESNAVGNLGVAYKKLGDYQKATHFYEQRLVIARRIGDRRGEGNTLGNLGNVYEEQGEIPKAIELYEQRLEIARDMGDKRGEAVALNNLGLAHDHLDQPAKAIEFYEQALIIDREIGDRDGEGTDLWNMSLALERLGRRDQAIARAEQSLVLREQMEDPRAEKVRAQLAAWRG